MKSFGPAKHADYYSACGSIQAYDLKEHLNYKQIFIKSAKTLIQNHITIPSVPDEITSCITVTHLLHLRSLDLKENLNP